MSLKEIIAELPKLTPDERREVFWNLLELSEGVFEPTEAMEEAISEGIRSAREESSITCDHARQLVAKWTSS